MSARPSAAPPLAWARTGQQTATTQEPEGTSAWQPCTQVVPERLGVGRPRAELPQESQPGVLPAGGVTLGPRQQQNPTQNLSRFQTKVPESREAT